MSHFFGEDCPLCGAPCGYSWVDNKSQKFFNCVQCTPFLVSSKAEERLKLAGQVWREVWSNQARSAPTHRRLAVDLPDGGSRPDDLMLGLSVLYVDWARVVASAEDQRDIAQNYQAKSSRVEVFQEAIAGDTSAIDQTDRRGGG